MSETKEELYQAMVSAMNRATHWQDQYMRDVEGQNNEGDYIGGVPGGLRRDVEYWRNKAETFEAETFEAELVALRGQTPVQEDCCAACG